MLPFFCTVLGAFSAYSLSYLKGMQRLGYPLNYQAHGHESGAVGSQS